MKPVLRSLSLGILGAALTLGAALPGTAFAAEDGKLLIWYSVDGAKAMRTIAKQFTTDTGVQVTVEAPEDGPAKFQQAAAGGKGPDIWIFAHDRIGEWIAGGLIQSIDPSKKIRDDIDPLAWKAFTTGGKVWGYPLSLETIALVYNKALVKTPPQTFADVMKLDETLSTQGKKAILWDYKNTYFTWPLLAANGGYAFQQNAEGSYDGTKTGVNNEGAVQGAELLNTLLRKKYMPVGSGYAEMEGAMAQGKVAMMINGPWSWDNLRKAKIDFGVAKIPQIDGKPAKPFVGVKGVMISKASPNRELAIEFIENTLLQPKSILALNEAEALGAPASKAVYAELKDDPFIAATMASAQDGLPMPSNPEMGRFWSAMESALTNVMDGRQSPKEALDAAAARILAK